MATRSAENVQVVVRCRPLSSQEISDKLPMVARVDEDQKEVTIEGTVVPIVQEVLDGYNCTIFAYGQTGTGKTYTMEGNRDTEDTSQLDSKARLKASREAGVISRSINTIFEHLGKTSDEYTVKVSHLELYNEELYDLLDPENRGLKMFEDPNNPTGTITVRGLTEVNVYNPRDIFNILEKSWNERTTAETSLNKESSRSHCIFSITIHMKERNMEGGEDLLKVGKLNLVDLAGSENVGKSGMSQKTSGRQEAGMINKSLLAFGRVITALVDQSPHVPYRESKLTRLLQDSLGGRTKTCIIATISPASVSLDETIGTLEYAHRAKSIKNQPQVNAKLTKKEFLGDYTMEIDSIRSQLDAMRRKDGVYMPNEQFVQLTDDLKNKSEEIDILLEEKKVKEKEFEEIQEVFDLQSKELKDTQTSLQDTQATLEATILELNDTLTAIEATRNDLFEHKVVLIERANIEAKFHQEAQVLLSTIRESLQDMEGLHTKVGREEELSAVNNAAWADKKEAIARRIKANEDLVQRFIDQQAQRFGALNGTLQAFTFAKEGELATLQAKLRELTATISASQKQLGDLVNLRLTEAQGQRDSLKAIQSDHVEATSKHLTTLTESVEAKVSTLVTTLSSFDQRTKAWSEVKDGELKESVVTTHQFAEQHMQKLDKFRSEAATRIETEIASYGENRTKMAAFMEQQKSETREFQTKIVATLSVMLADFVAHKEHAMDGTMQSFFKTFNERVDDLRGLRHSVESVTNDSVAQVAAFDKENATKKAAIIESVKKMSEITSGISKINTDQARLITVTAIAEVGKIKDANSKNLKALEGKLAEMQEKMTQGADEQRRQLSSIVAEATLASNKVNGTLTAALETTKASVGKWSNELDLTTNDALEFSASWKDDIAKLSAEVASFDLQRYVPDGTSPTKKTWSYPTDLPRMRSEAEIIAQFRNNGEYVPIIDPLYDAKKVAENSLKSINAAIKESDALSDLTSEALDLPIVAPMEPELEAPRLRSPLNKSKSRPLAPVSAPAPLVLARSNTRPINPTNPNLNRGLSAAPKPAPTGRENPRPAATANANPSAKPLLKRTNSQQQLVGAVGRKPMEVSNTLNKQ